MAKNNNDNSNIILEFIKANPKLSSKEIHGGLAMKLSYATVKRSMQNLISENLIFVAGKGRGTKYVISPFYELLHPIDPEKYFEKEIDERDIKHNFNFELISGILSEGSVFTHDELIYLNGLQKKYETNISKLF